MDSMCVLQYDTKLKYTTTILGITITYNKNRKWKEWRNQNELIGFMTVLHSNTSYYHKFNTMAWCEILSIYLKLEIVVVLEKSRKKLNANCTFKCYHDRRDDQIESAIFSISSPFLFYCAFFIPIPFRCQWNFRLWLCFWNQSHFRLNIHFWYHIYFT